MRFPRKCYKCKRWFFARGKIRHVTSRREHFYCSRNCAYALLKHMAKLSGMSIRDLCRSQGFTMEQWENSWR